MLHKILILSILIQIGLSSFNIDDYGAIPHSDNIKDQFTNRKALMDAINAANKSTTQRVVTIPQKIYYTMPIKFQYVNNLTIQILGRLAASKSVTYWIRDNNKKHVNFIQINNCINIQISGGGKIDGRGYHWWVLVYLNDKKYMDSQSDRPHLINIVDSQWIKVHDLILKNSAQFHIKLDRCHDVQIFNLDIKVNTTAQINLLKSLSLQGSIAMFPFNTDGIDPSGGRMHIYNLTVQNYDDVVVPKPSHDDDCTRDMLVENIQVRLGVGMSIGSVPPHQGGSCIRNITFRNVVMKRPFKGIYVKTNPGDRGWGNITDIYYKNITMDRPIWWAIYIGPQQMRQPGGAGPGCMVYPFDPRGTCSTQPRVTVKNITLQDIEIHKSLLYPVTIRCNVSNPCTQINFNNVKTDKWLIGQKQKGCVCQFATGSIKNSSPMVECLKNDEQLINSNVDANFVEQSSDKEKLNQNDLILQQKQQINGLMGQQFQGQNWIDKQDIIKSYIRIINKFKRRNKRSLLLQRLVEQIHSSAKQIEYQDSEDDQFEYDIAQIKRQFEHRPSAQQLIS